MHNAHANFMDIYIGTDACEIVDIITAIPICMMLTLSDVYNEITIKKKIYVQTSSNICLMYSFIQRMYTW